MGILAEPLAFMSELPLPPEFSVCELGDQWVTCASPHYLARKFYMKLGAARYVSIDGNGRGTVTHDLNLPPPPRLGLFHLVTDFGTGEHVFDQARVWRTLHELCMPGGYIVFDRPSAGYDRHCFYLVKRELLDDIARSNGYSVLRLEGCTTPRGELLRGVWQLPMKVRKFRFPWQGRYKKSRRVE